MAGTTNILQWNPTSANQETDSEYQADSQRSGGATDPSTFASDLANKAFYQWSTYLTALFTAFANKGFTTSDSNVSTLTSVCANFLTTADVLPNVQNVAYAPSLVLNARQANGFYIQNMTGNLTISNITGLTAGQIVALYYQQDSVGGRTVTSAGVGACQPDPAPNSVSVQFFSWDSNTNALRAVSPLISNNGTFTGGLLTASQFTLASGAPAGYTLTGDGTKFTAQLTNPTTTMSIVTGARAFTTVYHNASPFRLTVSAGANLPGGVGQGINLYGNVGSTSSVQKVAVNSVTNSGGDTGVTFIVPPGYYYSVTWENDGGSPSPVLTIWTEWVN